MIAILCICIFWRRKKKNRKNLKCEESKPSCTGVPRQGPASSGSQTPDTGSPYFLLLVMVAAGPTATSFCAGGDPGPSHLPLPEEMGASTSGTSATTEKTLSALQLELEDLSVPPTLPLFQKNADDPEVQAFLESLLESIRSCGSCQERNAFITEHLRKVQNDYGLLNTIADPITRERVKEIIIGQLDSLKLLQRTCNEIEDLKDQQRQLFQQVLSGQHKNQCETLSRLNLKKFWLEMSLESYGRRPR